MTADLLREASALMRRRAEAATPGPWRADQGSSGGWWVEVLNTATIAAVDEDYSGSPAGDAAHIASWHPAVALAVADWLDRIVADHEGWPDCDASDEELESAENVARAYLGRES